MTTRECQTLRGGPTLLSVLPGRVRFERFQESSDPSVLRRIRI